MITPVTVVMIDLAHERGDELGLLDAVERGRHDSLQLERDRRRFRIAHARCREILGAVCGKPPAILEIRRHPQGKPWIDGEVSFSLSHSEELALCGLVRGRILGVDVEAMRPLPDVMSLAGRVLSKIEHQLVIRAPVTQRAGAFLRLWTRKEAVLKAIGVGLIDELDAIDVSTSRPSSECAAIDPDRLARLCVADLELPIGFVGALAVERSSTEDAATVRIVPAGAPLMISRSLVQ
jgi:4'-phosphopantetheinyl transferase